MPQGRIILKSICQSKKLASLKTDGARLLYTWLIPNLDVNGCFSGDTKVVKGQIFTRLKKSEKTIAGHLEDLQSVGLIIVYESNSDVYLFAPDFVDKQPRLNPDREGKTNIPPPTPEQLKSYSRVTPPKVKERKVKESKDKYRDFVFLTKDEHKKLLTRYGDKNTRRLIANLNRYIGSKGDKYKSHYYTILNFAKRDNIPELKPPEESDDKKALEKRNAEVRKDEGKYFREQDKKTLEKWLKDPAKITRHWLIEEILKEHYD